jgi:hypothetical protein
MVKLWLVQLAVLQPGPQRHALIGIRVFVVSLSACITERLSLDCNDGRIKASNTNLLCTRNGWIQPPDASC